MFETFNAPAFYVAIQAVLSSLSFSCSGAHGIISSIVGRPRHQGVMVGMGQKNSYVG
ncbi:hypothetical protein MPER_00473 [Moniliophthora perniciosa FA553]|nr:hypothetical protein MPER_00473 [Moniliophthora perniciosa FA553]